MTFDIFTLFPGMFSSVLSESMIGRGLAGGLFSVHFHDIRSFARGPHRMVDDYPFGGGRGMVMKPEPIVACLEAVRKAGTKSTAILLTPAGERFSQKMAWELSSFHQVILLCGHYEGVDDRVRAFVDREISIGDFVLTGGEPAAWVIVDAVARLIPGVLGNKDSIAEESFEGGLLEYPQFTRPRVFRGIAVPEVLLSGDHEAISTFRRQKALERTFQKRPDLLRQAVLSPEEKNLIRQWKQDKKKRSRRAGR